MEPTKRWWQHFAEHGERGGGANEKEDSKLFFKTMDAEQRSLIRML